MVSSAFHLKDSESFAQKALQWAAKFDSVCYLDSNGYRDNYGNINVFIAVGEEKRFISPEPRQDKSSECKKDTFAALQDFIDQHPNTWIPGFLAYDLKNELEELDTTQSNWADMPDAYFFVPAYTLLIGQYNVEIKGEDPASIMSEINKLNLTEIPLDFNGKLQYRMSRNAYFDAFDKIQDHLKKGDCYEVNLCQEFYAENASLNPLGLYQRLNESSPTPFSCFFKWGEKYILSASPERFLTKQGKTLLSQPIKGTARRGNTGLEDEKIKNELLSSEKERSENVMIVDLVRNDLTKSAKPGSVQVPELTKVYSFRQVHQLISTVSCEINEDISVTQAIANTFPPGSMTGAPKVRAMQLIDHYENSRRGIYSGALGYFGPQGNFDFSVVIRTLIYNAEKQYLSFHTGGAITIQSNVEDEYHESLLKGKALFEVLKGV